MGQGTWCRAPPSAPGRCYFGLQIHKVLFLRKPMLLRPRSDYLTDPFMLLRLLSKIPARANARGSFVYFLLVQLQAHGETMLLV
jgi:hypothetical protein